MGALFFGHGTQKLCGWFGGGGPSGSAQFFESAGLRPGKRTALAAGAAEAGGGVLLAAGLATPVASALLSGVMLTAIRHVHWRNGPWATKGGYEYNLTIVALLAALVETGPGPLSLDAALGIERRGSKPALATLGAGALGSLLAPAAAARGAGSQPAEPAPAQTGGPVPAR